MGKSVLKDIFREVKNSLERFFAIFGIVAIGVAFFAGVTASSTDMKHSSDLYYDQTNLMDLKLVSSIGFNEDDINAIKKVNGVKGLFATHSADFLTSVNKQDAVVKVMGLPNQDLEDDNDNYINRPRLLEGRLPQQEGECVLRIESSREMPAMIGETITLKSGNDTEISESLQRDSYEVVGIVESPYYLSYDLGQSEIGNGSISYLMMVYDSEFLGEYDTEVYATVEGAKDLDTYSDAYKNAIDSVKHNVEAVEDTCIDARIQEIKDKFSEEKSKAELEVYDQIAQSVRTQLEQQYQIYYPGIDVSPMVDAVYETALDRAIAGYDFNSLYQKIDQKQEETLADCDSWQWYVLDRDMLQSYREYESSADRMDAIAKVFPIFFIFVAALVCLTTMTRMVDEQRGLIGIYKALGYSKTVIALKYLLYAFVVSVAGGITGCLIGLRLFPNVIYNAWRILFRLPPITYANHFVLSIIAIVSMTMVTCLSSYIACNQQLIEVPSELMRPKAPKIGKTILLEHITFIWKRVSFTGKVTARNIFRYKKRFFMTVFGVAGCSALLLAGYGIKDSITGLIDKQFTQIQKYDIVLKMEDDTDEQKVNDMLDLMNQDQNLNQSIKIGTYSSEVHEQDFESENDSLVVQSLDKTATINVVQDPLQYQQFVTLRSRKGKINYELDDDGICITEKIANDLKVKSGDYVYLQSQEGKVAKVRISHVVEMYVDHFVYMTSSYYQKTFGETILDNTILGKANGAVKDIQADAGEKYLSYDEVKSITFISSNAEKFNNMIQSMNSVTVVLIISAAFLAFIVSYNLTNVNISERIREIATIKVLGFYDNEVSAYVFRENIIISIIGAFVGLILGVILHGFIMKTVEMDTIMFGNQINFISFVYAFALTIIFSTFVNAIMYFKLKKIPMVESLKSVE